MYENKSIVSFYFFIFFKKFRKRCYKSPCSNVI